MRARWGTLWLKMMRLSRFVNRQNLGDRPKSAIVKKLYFSMPIRHRMKLTPENFEQLKSGHKTIESRLNDEKRKALRVGERIEFAKLPELQTSIIVEIVSLDTYKNFSELYAAGHEAVLGTTQQEYLKRIHEYYTKQEEDKYGVVAIGVKLV